jgi:glycosyltransferase involved in cell wall biosynthesis
VELLKRSATEHKIVVLGVAFPEEPALVSFKSGSLTQEEVDALYQDASVVLFPSHYEGFGLPIMHALARGLPVVARTLPVFEEIRARTEHGRNVHLRASTEEMVAFALTDPQWASPQSPARPAQTWERASEDLEEGITRAIARFDGQDLRRRMESAELCRNWFDAMDQADALWLGGERTSTRRLSQASRQDQSRTDLRAQLVSYARHNHLFWNARARPDQLEAQASSS